MPRLAALILASLAALALGLLVSGSGLPDHLLPGGLPLGNLLAAMALCSIAGAAFLLSPRGSGRGRFAAMALLASLLWLPVSVLLAGNLALNFSGARGTAWLVGSVAVVVATLAALAWAMVGCAVRRLRLP